MRCISMDCGDLIQKLARHTPLPLHLAHWAPEKAGKPMTNPKLSVLVLSRP